MKYMENPQIYELKIKVRVFTTDSRYEMKIESLAACTPSNLPNVKEQAKADALSFVKNTTSLKRLHNVTNIEVSLRVVKKEFLKIY